MHGATPPQIKEREMITRNPATPSPWQKMLGIELSPVSHGERLLSALGGFVGLLAVYFVSQMSGSPSSPPLLIFSIAASAVLVFAVPHGALSQPWPVVGGHLVSALIGVACARYLPNEALAAATAVGLSIAAMHYLRCIHPPAGATALTAVLGGESLRALGFGFVMAPVLRDVLVILAVAIAFNAVLPWRRYPAFLARRAAMPEPAPASHQTISHEDFIFALSQMDSFIDVSEEDMLRIYDIATGPHRNEKVRAT